MQIIDFKIIKYSKLIHHMHNQIHLVIIEETDKSLVETLNRQRHGQSQRLSDHWHSEKFKVLNFHQTFKLSLFDVLWPKGYWCQDNLHMKFQYMYCYLHRHMLIARFLLFSVTDQTTSWPHNTLCLFMHFYLFTYDSFQTLY